LAASVKGRVLKPVNETICWFLGRNEVFEHVAGHGSAEHDSGSVDTL